MDISAIEKVLTLPSPLQKIDFRDELLSAYNVYIKRDECIHPLISGNKWRKLKHQLLTLDAEISQIISFGGCYSNHLLALASACNMLNLDSVGFIRTYNPLVETHSMAKMSEMGMTLCPLHPKVYDAVKEDHTRIFQHISPREKHCIIEEGGSSRLAFKGISEIITEVNLQSTIAFNYLFTAVGTGTTLAGFANSFRGTAIYGIAVFKEKIRSLKGLDLIQAESGKIHLMNCRLGLRFGKQDLRISAFIKKFESDHNITLDSVYTARAMINLIEMLKGGELPKGANILFYHSGGLQGNQAF